VGKTPAGGFLPLSGAPQRLLREGAMTARAINNYPLITILVDHLKIVGDRTTPGWFSQCQRRQSWLEQDRQPYFSKPTIRHLKSIIS